MTLLELLQTHGVPYRLAGDSPHVTPGWVGCICPWCGQNTEKFGLGFHLSSHACSCWKCNGHYFLDALSRLTGESWDRLRELLEVRSYPRPTEKPRGQLALPQGLGPLQPPHQSYLYQRGFDPQELVRLWGIQGIGLQAHLAWRLFLPVTVRGHTVSWTTRALHDDGRRYLNARPDEEAQPLKHCLYGLDYVQHTAVIVEGPTDAWRIGPGAVALFGLAYTRAQLAQLSQIPVRVICFDNEPAAQQRARVLQDQLLPFEGQTWVVELDAEDPGSASPQEIKKLRRRFLRTP